MKNENFCKNMISPTLILSNFMADKFAGSYKSYQIFQSKVFFERNGYQLQ